VLVKAALFFVYYFLIHLKNNILKIQAKHILMQNI